MTEHPHTLCDQLYPVFSFVVARPPPGLPLFPYTTLFRSRPHLGLGDQLLGFAPCLRDRLVGGSLGEQEGAQRDRKSTRLNSSHLGISYAVFCLKKKTSSTFFRPAFPKHPSLGP